MTLPAIRRNQVALTEMHPDGDQQRAHHGRATAGNIIARRTASNYAVFAGAQLAMPIEATAIGAAQSSALRDECINAGDAGP